MFHDKQVIFENLKIVNFSILGAQIYSNVQMKDFATEICDQLRQSFKRKIFFHKNKSTSARGLKTYNLLRINCQCLLENILKVDIFLLKDIHNSFYTSFLHL